MALDVTQLGGGINRMTYVVEVYREKVWHIVGQYSAKYQAQRIADDYRSRGEKVRITYE